MTSPHPIPQRGDIVVVPDLGEHADVHYVITGADTDGGPTRYGAHRSVAFEHRTDAPRFVQREASQFSPAGPQYVLTNVVDRQEVSLHDVTGAPLVPKSHGSTSIVVDTIVLRYERAAPGQPYRTVQIRVLGWRAKKDGTAGGQDAEESYNGEATQLVIEPSKYRTDAPAWLRELAEQYRPVEPGATHRYIPVDDDRSIPFERW